MRLVETPDHAAAAGKRDAAAFVPWSIVTRRRFLGGTLGSMALLGLAACGRSGDPGSSATTSATGSASASAPASAAATALTIATIHGDVEIPAAADRIVAVDFPELCALLDLGIAPVGRPGYVPDFPAYNTATADIPTIDEADTGELVLEKIAALKPDLIIGDDWADPAKQYVPYDTLAKIAPTALFAWQQAAGNWPTLAAQTAAAVDKTAELDALKNTYTDKAAGIKSDYARLFASTTWDIIDCNSKTWDLYSANSSHGQVLTAAGVPLNAAKSQSAGYQEYSFEQFGVLVGTDVIVTTTASLPFLEKQPLYQTLPAVKSGRVYTTDLFFPASYGIATALLDDLKVMCTKASG